MNVFVIRSQGKVHVLNKSSCGRTALSTKCINKTVGCLRYKLEICLVFSIAEQNNIWHFPHLLEEHAVIYITKHPTNIRGFTVILLQLKRVEGQNGLTKEKIR